MNNNILKIRIVFIIITCLSFIKTSGQDLKKHRWEHRIFIVKNMDITSEKYQQQLKEINKSLEGMIERKLVLYTIINDDFHFLNYENCQLDDAGKISQKVKKILNPKEGFEVILIGLDGLIKLKQIKVLTQKDLFNKVDSMPMRSNELRTKQKKN